MFWLRNKKIKFSLCTLKETKSVTLNFFRKNKFRFKSVVKIELSYVFIIHMFIKVENCMEM